MKKYILKFRGLFFINIIAIILYAFVNVGFALTLQPVVDAGAEMNIEKLKSAAIVAILVLILYEVVVFLKNYCQAKFLRNALVELKNDIFSSFLSRDIGEFNEENSANHISTLTNDIKIVEEDYFTNILNSIFYIVSCVVSTVTLTIINPIITVFIFITAALPILIPMIFGKALSKSKKTYSDNMGKFTTKVKDILSGFEVIKSFNIEKKSKEDYEKANYKSENSKYKFTILNSLVNRCSSIFGNIIFMGVMVLAVYFVIKGDMSLGLMLVSTQLMNYVIQPIMMLSENVARFKSVKEVNHKITNIINSKKEIDKGVEINRFNKDITFENIEFSYEKERKILNGASFTLRKGEKYAIVGGSGSGKSTLLKLLLRFYDDYTGEIKIDNKEIRDIKVSSLYKLISVIHQNVFMFDDSIENNISLYGDYDENKVNNAIEKSGLKTLVESLKDGSNTSVGENGCNLSGGEKQRIAIARALIKNTPILVLDEATSSLDNETAYNIESSILALEELTSLVVTHKLNKEILSRYDKIIVLKEGKVTEIGTFEELLERREYFYSLYNVMNG